MSIVGPARNLNRRLILHLYRGSDEKNAADDVQGALHKLGVTPRILRKNPVTDDVWKLVLDHGQLATAIGSGLLGVLLQWVKQRTGRRIEIERPGLKVKVSTTRELEHTLAALHNYDEMSLTLNNAKAGKRVAKVASKKR